MRRFSAACLVLCLSLGAALLHAAAVFDTDASGDGPGSQWAYWAPGVLNQDEGAVEFDVTFSQPISAMKSDWKFLFRATGNAPDAGTTVLGLVLCPPRDTRRMPAIFRSGRRGALVDADFPAIELGKPNRVALVWGKGQAALWWNGEPLGKASLPGPLSLLPARFVAGLDSESGPSRGYRITALRVSDAPPLAAALKAQAPAPLRQDDHTTLLLGDGAPPALGKTAWQAGTYRAGLFLDREREAFTVPEGKELELPLCGVVYQDSPALFRVRCELRDRDGNEVAAGARSGEVAMAPGGEYRPAVFAVPALADTGWYAGKLHVTDPQGRESVYDFGFVVQPADGAKPGKLAGYLGHHNKIFDPLGIRWRRAWAGDRVFHWCNVEAVQGDFHWEAADRVVAQAQADGVSLLGMLGNPPPWASTYSAEERDRLKVPPKGQYSNSPDRYQPRSLDEWKAYVRAVVSRYHDRVKYWEVYNEVDFHPPAMQASFSGTTADYLALLRAVHEIVREVDPSCQVLSSGFSLTKGVTDWRMPLDLLKLGGADAFDVFNCHGYSDRKTILDTVQAVRAAKPGVPLWMSEYMYESPTDDYAVATKAFWFLEQGFSKFFLHGGELDRNVGELGVTPFYAVTAELARQLGACDALLGPVEGVGDGCASWRLSRGDGSFLQAFAVDNGGVSVTFAAAVPALRVTDLYGKTLFRGPLAAGQPLAFSGMVYAVSPAPLAVASFRREHGNVLANPGFEVREGDFMADETAARPSSWTLRPDGAPPRLMTFVPGRSGSFALRIASTAEVRNPAAGQLVSLDAAGAWRLSAWVRAPAGSTGTCSLRVNHGGAWTEAMKAPFTGSGSGPGEWQRVQASGALAEGDRQGVVLIRLDGPDQAVEIDDAELIFDANAGGAGPGP